MSDVIFDYDVPDPVALPDGEYKVAVVSAELTESKAGRPMIHSVFRPVDNPEGQLVHEYLVLPSKPTNDDEKVKVVRKQREIKHYFSAFNAPTSFSSPGDMDAALKAIVGKEAWAQFKTEADDTFGDKNRIARWIRSA